MPVCCRREAVHISHFVLFDGIVSMFMFSFLNQCGADDISAEATLRGPHMATVDVVIPNYNYGRYLRESVNSVLSQEHADVRVLIVDNCSTDNSAEIAQDLVGTDRRVEFVRHQVNRGATESYNEGIDWAASDYFLVLDADDMLAPGALARATEVLDRHGDVAFTTGVEGRIEGDVFSPACSNPNRPDWKLKSGMEVIQNLCLVPVCNVGANTVIRRTSIQKAAGYYRNSLPYTDDLEMWLRLSTLGRVAQTRAVQAYRRIHSSQHSAHYTFANHCRDFSEREAAFRSFFENEGASIPEKDHWLERVRTGLGEHAYWSAVSHFLRGYRSTSIQLMRFSRERRRVPAIIPPLHWLLKMERPAARISQILAESMPLPKRKPSAPIVHETKATASAMFVQREEVDNTPH